MVKQYISKKGYDFEEITSKILGACIEVHKTLGPGFEEVIYQRALAKELRRLKIKFVREKWIDVVYKGELIGRKRVDFIFEEAMLEIKAKNEFEPQDYIQTLSYLKASGCPVGLLVNFGAEKIEIKRLVNNKKE